MIFPSTRASWGWYSRLVQRYIERYIEYPRLLACIRYLVPEHSACTFAHNIRARHTCQAFHSLWLRLRHLLPTKNKTKSFLLGPGYNRPHSRSSLSKSPTLTRSTILCSIAICLATEAVDTRFVSLTPTRRISLDSCANARRAMGTCVGM